MAFSLGSTFARQKESVEMVLPRRSLLVMTGKARYGCTHEIKARRFDKIDQMKCERKRRISLTFRSLAHK